MTREEAIGKMEEEKGYYVSYLSAGKIIGKAEEWGKAIEAYDMAIEALKREQQLLDAGYQNTTIDFYIGGRLFRAKEIAQ